jgi:hypothetical protein
MLSKNGMAELNPPEMRPDKLSLSAISQLSAFPHTRFDHSFLWRFCDACLCLYRGLGVAHHHPGSAVLLPQWKSSQ